MVRMRMESEGDCVGDSVVRKTERLIEHKSRGTPL